MPSDKDLKKMEVWKVCDPEKDKAQKKTEKAPFRVEGFVWRFLDSVLTARYFPPKTSVK